MSVDFRGRRDSLTIGDAMRCRSPPQHYYEMPAVNREKRKVRINNARDNLVIARQLRGAI